ncbi:MULTISPECIES: AraC family transcriptional regulator [Acetobacteraceae]|uniref:AraC family transcriptional regulator n=1 Tax=Acetobacteraceae TaxID=433 RepID=UPI000A3691C9|nr:MULTISPECIES: AraC family transcriptional regulator [Acetobacteraceae]MBS1063006.1 AraC family transcriptional regulator [Gluconobacter wancherniae]
MLDRAIFMRDSAKMNSDPLSDVLNLANARCVLTGKLFAGNEWSRKFQRNETVKFLAVVKGSCWILKESSGVEATVFQAGDVVITNGAPSIILASRVDGLEGASDAPLKRDAEGNFRIGDGSDFVMIGGLVEVDEQRCGFLRASLPPMIHVNGQTTEATKLRWILTELAEETLRQRAGSVIAITHLAKLLFVEALRLHIEAAKSIATGWLTALDDKRISVALRRIHAEPAHAWNLEELAKLSGMSRTSFAVRFREIVGVPPLTYVLNWRMRLAERELSETDHSVADIAWSLGYGSESAFSNAFSRATGCSPGRFRKESMQNYLRHRHHGKRRAPELREQVETGDIQRKI